MFDAIFFVGIGLTLNFFLSFVIIFLDVHKNGTQSAKARGDKRGRETAVDVFVEP